VTGGGLLIVEDDPADLELALHAFARSNMTNPIDVVRDGAEALEYLFATGRYENRGSQPVPRVVLLDLKLPFVGGVEVLAEMKSDPRTRNIPVVVLTSSREDSDLIRCYDLGVNSYIVKPVDIDQFLRTIAEIGVYWMVLNERRA
jgi:two-component system response regulator